MQVFNQTERNQILEEIHFRELGEGASLLLLHGFCESGRIFDGIVESLAKHCHILIPDLPGHGQTAWNNHIRSLDEVAFWLRDFLDAKEIEKITLVGHSMGGYVAAAFAEYFPERLKALGMMHSTSLGDTDSRKENRTKAIEFIKRNGKSAFLEVFVASLFHEPQASWTQSLQKITSLADREAILAFTQIMRDRPDRSAVIRELEIPVMYITGEMDALVAPERSREELQDIPFAILKRIQEASHMGMYEAPQKVIDALLSLVEMGGA